MRLGFHYHTPAKIKDGKIFMAGYIGLFIDSIASELDSLVCFLHTPNSSEEALLTYPLQSKNIEFVNLGPHSSIPSRTIKGFKQRNIFKEWESKIDVLLIRASTPLLPIISMVWRKPMALLLVSDATEGLDNLPQPTWRKILIKVWAKWYQSRENAIAKKCLTFVNSKALYNKLEKTVPNLVLTRTTTLSKNDFYRKSHFELNQPIKVLYTGRISKIKGLLDIAQAILKLSEKGHQIEFHLVGMLDKKESILSDLEDLFKEKNLKGHLIFHGFKTAGPELLSYYRQSDIFVTASQASSEGFPRTIWEAMASSLPVIATKVGSIPFYIKDEAILINPKDIKGIEESLELLIQNEEKRKVLIQKGLELSKENTLEVRAQEMIEKIKSEFLDK